MKSKIKLKYLINIPKSLLFLYIIANASIDIARAQKSNLGENYIPKNITLTGFKNPEQEIAKLYMKQSFNNKTKDHTGFKYSSLAYEESSLKQHAIHKEIEAIKISNQTLIKLKDLGDLIKKNSNELKVLEIKIEEARYILRSEIAAWYPTLNISSTGLPQYITGNAYNALSTNTSSNQIKASLTATVKWDLINPSRKPEIELAKDQFEKAKLAYSIKYRDLFLEAHIQFFNLQKSIQDIRIAKDSIKFSETSLKEAISRKDAGLAANFDVLEARTQLSQDKQLLAERIGYKKINERTLAQLLNLKSNTSPTIDSNPKIVGLWDTSLEESILEGLQYRKELDNVKLGISINNNKANIADANNKPKISIYNTVDGYIAKGEVGGSPPRDNNNINSTNTTIGIQLSWPVFDGGYTKATYSASKEKVKEVQVELALTKRQIRKEIEESFFKLNIAKENIKNSYDAIQSAKESLRLSHLRLKAGIATQREVVNNQRDLTQSEVKHIQALTEYNTHIISLQSKTGINELKDCTKKINSDNASINKKIPNLPSNHLSLNKDSCLELL